MNTVKFFLIIVSCLLAMNGFAQGKVSRPQKKEPTKKETPKPKPKPGKNNSTTPQTSKEPNSDDKLTPIYKLTPIPKTQYYNKNIYNSNSLKIDGGSFEIVKIESDGTNTYIYKKFYPSKTPNAIWSVSNEWIENPQTKNKIYIKDSEIGFSYYSITNLTPFIFKETYPAIPSDWESINIGSNNFYFLRNLTP